MITVPASDSSAPSFAPPVPSGGPHERASTIDRPTTTDPPEPFQAFVLDAGADIDEVETPESGRARWERPALVVLLAATAVLYLWGLGASGWANSFYSAAAQAGSKSWKAWLFGSSDASNSITVDKPPASLWVMGLSVRVFGLSSWSLLVPEAMMGVASVGLVYASVRRWFSAHAALLAGAVLATTPVAALMFRFNNPDAQLALVMIAAAYCTLRGIESGGRGWIVATGALIGFGFLTKQLQVLLVVPPLTLAYLVSAPHRLGRRIVDVLIAGAAMVVAAGWWIAIVALTPAANRPYIGGSQHNSIIELTLGYNGFGRLTGNETGSVGGRVGRGGGNMWGQTGISRLVDGVLGGQIAWLLPAALVAIGVGLWATRRAVRHDVARAAIIVWGGWLICTAAVFSYMQGIFHEYYTVALAPAIAALIGIGGHLAWQRRTRVGYRVVLAGTMVGTALWSATLLGRASSWNSWLRPVVIVAGLIAAAAILFGHRLSRTLTAAMIAAGVVACLGGQTAWAVQTAATAHNGSIVTAGPAVARGAFGPGGNRGGAGFPGRRGLFPNLGGGPPANLPGFPGALPGGAATGGGTAGAAAGAPVGGAGIGGLLDASTPDAALVDALTVDSGDYTWVAAAVGSNRAAGLQLATELPVMAVGGFNGSDPSPTLAQFQGYVAQGRIHWFVAGGGFGQSQNGSAEATSIAAWVADHYTASTIGGTTVYDLTATPTS